MKKKKSSQNHFYCPTLEELEMDHATEFLTGIEQGARQRLSDGKIDKLDRIFEKIQAGEKSNP